MAFRKAAIPMASKRALLEREGCPVGTNGPLFCSYCNERGCVDWYGSYPVIYFLEYDHLDPEWLGGSSEPDNLVFACRPCNRAKGRRPLLSWLVTR